MFSIRRKLSNRRVGSSLLVGLLVIAVLSAPSGIFLAAQNATATPDGMWKFTGQLDQPASLSPDQPARGADGGGDRSPVPAQKVPESVLESKDETSELFGPIVPSEALEFRIKDTNSRLNLVLIEAEPGGATVPPQLLQRPPPRQ